MLSALIPSGRSQPAMPLARQLAHQRSVRPGPLVLGAAPLKSPAPTADRDRTVSRRSKPSSRASLTGEQPDPWDLLSHLLDPSVSQSSSLVPLHSTPDCQPG